MKSERGQIAREDVAARAGSEQAVAMSSAAPLPAPAPHSPAAPLTLPAPAGRPRPRAATTLLVGTLAALVKLATALPVLTRYGWDRDELYFVQASRHLALGYVDFPAATALVGRATIALFGPSLVALRLTGVLATMAATILVACCARELGGGVAAQAIAALAFVASPYGLGLGMLFHPTMFDVLDWVAFAYVALRVLGRPEPRLWPLLGAIAGLGFEVKGTMLAFVACFVVALLAVGPRASLRGRGPWIAAAIALACAGPYVVWELLRGWPTLAFLPSQDAVTAAATPRGAYVLQQLAFLGAGVPLVVAGTIGLWRCPRRRALALLLPAVSLLFLVEHGRSYYALPAVALPLAAGAVAAERWWPRARRRTVTVALAGTLGLGATSIALAAPIVWPVLPTSTMVRLGLWQPAVYDDELGWPALVSQVAQTWRALPAADRARTVVLAANYGEAGALDLFGPARGLPHALSGHLSFQYWHPAHMDTRSLLTVGFSTSTLAHLCAAYRVRARVTTRWGPAASEHGALIATCRLRAPLGRIWSSQLASDAL